MSNSHAKVICKNGFDMYICRKASRVIRLQEKDGTLYRISPEIPAATF
jgi:hypothetical protein